MTKAKLAELFVAAHLHVSSFVDPRTAQPWRTTASQGSASRGKWTRLQGGSSVWLHIPQSRSVQESAGSISAYDPSYRLASSCTASGKSHAPRFWRRACGTAYWTKLLSGAMLERSLAKSAANTFARQLAGEAWMQSMGASPASHTQSPASGKAPTTSGTCGPQPAPPSSSISPESSSLKTSPESWSTCPKGLSLICDGLGTSCLDRSCLKPKASERVRNGSGCSSWPSSANRDFISEEATEEFNGSTRDSHPRGWNWTTPAVHECETANRPSREATGRLTEYLGREAAQWNLPRSSGGGGHVSRGNERADLNRQSALFHPAQASDLTALLARFSNLSKPERSGPMIAFLRSLLNGRRGSESSKSDPTSHRPRLNPAFVEWLMGMPENWLSLGPINCGR